MDDLSDELGGVSHEIFVPLKARFLFYFGGEWTCFVQKDDLERMENTVRGLSIGEAATHEAGPIRAA
nr:hypothetical protein H0235_012317 [Vespula pensylvanica]